MKYCWICWVSVISDEFSGVSDEFLMCFFGFWWVFNEFLMSFWGFLVVLLWLGLYFWVYDEFLLGSDEFSGVSDEFLMSFKRFLLSLFEVMSFWWVFEFLGISHCFIMIGVLFLMSLWWAFASDECPSRQSRCYISHICWVGPSHHYIAATVPKYT